MSDSQPLRCRIEVPKRFAGARFDRVLAELFPERTRSQLQKLVRRGNVALNGRRVLRSNMKLAGGEELSVQEGGAQDSSSAQPELSLIVLQEEEDFVVVHKPAGMLTHPTERHAGGTVADIVEERFGPLPSTSDAYRPGIVHRLDRETSGVMVIARNQHALDDMRLQFRRRTVAKRYVAVVYGAPAENHFEVSAPLGAVDGHRDLQRVRPEGRPAHTEFEVLRRWSKFALLACHPSTGRRHQLRVHLQSIGHPIVGDKLYRPRAGVERVSGLPCHALHAESLAFDRPGGAGRVECRSELPEELTQLLVRLDSGL